MRMNNVMAILAMAAQTAGQYMNPFNLAPGENAKASLGGKRRKGWYNAYIPEERLKWSYIGNGQFRCRQSKNLIKTLENPMTREEASIRGLL